MVELAESHLILGGRRSGKSLFAENLVLGSGMPKTYVATSRAYDADHQQRIAAHRTRRENHGWKVIETADPSDLQAILDSLALEPGAVLVDCLSMWLNNIFLDANDTNPAIPHLIIPSGPAKFIFVSMEVGLGLHGDTALGRSYTDALGTLNQSMARQCQAVTFIAAGLPLTLKD